MEKVADKKESGGHLEVYEDLQRNIFLARPHGFINPGLVSKDLDKAREFAYKVRGNWTYITDTSDIQMVNPFNLLFLKEIKKIPGLKQIVIYVPKTFNYVLLKMVQFLIQPDRIIRDENEFVNFMGRKLATGPV